MTHVVERGVRASAPRRRIGVRQLLVAAALFAVAVVPIRHDLAGPVGQESLGAEARMQLGWEVHTRRALAAGEVPLWNPYHFGGRPHLADPATLALYPPHVLLRFLPIGSFFVASFVCHAWMFGLGSYLVARRLGASALASFLGAVGVMLAGVLVPRPDLVYSPALYSIAWLPLVLALTMRAVQQPRVLPGVPLVAVLVMALTGPPPGPVYALAVVASCYLLTVLWPAGASGSRRPLLVRLSVVLVIAVALSAFQLVPYARLRTGAAWAGGPAQDDPRARPTPATAMNGNPRLAAAITALGGGRTISQCDEALDASRFLWSGIAGVEGYGGTFPGDYGRFADLVSGAGNESSVVRATIPSAHPSVRGDLLSLLNVRYLVTCSPPDPERWESVTEVGGAIISRARDARPRAFWTCAPRRVGRRELEYRLRRYRYDDTLTLRDASPMIHVRWTAVDEVSRAGVEAALHIRPRRYIEDRTWQYDLLDASRANLAAIVGHPAVEDTAGFDRGALSFPSAPPVPPFDERRSEWLVGVDECDGAGAGTAERMDRADGHVVATIDAPRDGLVFLSETYHPDRAAWVDGRRVEPLKVNLAFTGVPVAAGVHRVELRADASALWFGAGVSMLTMIAWAIGAWAARPR